ncbi:MAG TPA: VOC family protein [Solirubrobacteraceae bacterium]|nr:VOC family protein [Solirubrobacteraceae bacterium]
MEGHRGRVRLRQAVLVAAELEPVERALRDALGLDEPYRDPGVAEFGIVNAVFALGDCFIEVIAPERDDTAAGRYLDRHGDGGYMAIFDLDDLEAARARVADDGIRVIWRIDLPDISGTHLHPADLGGAIVSLDRSDPYGSWRWGGPRWIGQVADGASGRLAGITVAVPDPATVATRWARALGVEPADASELSLRLDGDGEVRFVATADEQAEGIIEIVLADVPTLAALPDGIVIGGVKLRPPAVR